MASTLISASFDIDEDGFVFRDDAFRDTNQPIYADGQRVDIGGADGGVLRVLLGGIDDADITGMSGGWDRAFTLATAQLVTLTFRVKLTQASDYEPDEFSEALVALDGTLLSSNGGDFIARIAGNGNGGGPRTTDWLDIEINLGILPAGNHTLTFGGFNNKKTLANEETEILFDDIEVVADDPPPGPGEGVLIDASFDVGTEGFVFLDDTFRGTDEPDYADGQFTATGGFSGGGLVATLGGVDDTDVNGMSGGFQASFTLTEEAVVTIGFRYNLTQAANYEADEFSQVLLSLDGTPVGIDGNDFIAQINGDGNGGPERSTGWQVVEINLGLLGPGDHELIIGGFNNRKTLADEEAILRIDDVLVTELPPPPPGDIVLLQSDFDSDAGGFGFIDDAFRGTDRPDYADGQRSPTAGFGGGGALTVELGNIDNDDILGMSGGWRQTFNVGADTPAVLSFRYKLTQAPNFEADEFSQVLVDLDGTLISTNGNDFIDRIAGNGNGGPERSTGWQVVELDLGVLTAGSHTLTIGGFNNKKTFADEHTEILIDDLLLTAGGTAPIVDLDPDDSSGATGSGYSDTFTEAGDGPPPAAGTPVPIGDVDLDIDDPDGTQLQGATVTLTNPKAGDLLSLAAALPVGIGLDGGSTASQIVLTGLASLADYETALAAVRFAAGGGDTPDTGQRVITVEVVDEIGLPSNTAVATIDVVATNDFPTPLDDDLGATDEDSVLAAGPGGLLLGSLFDDNGSGLDGDPEGDGIDVAGLSTVVPPVLPAGTVASAVSDNGTSFSFTLTAAAQVATVFVDKETGNVTVEATTGDFFGLLDTGETATVGFDYTVADPQGSNGTTATATFDVTGVSDAPDLDLDADDSSGATGTDYADTFTEVGDGPPATAGSGPVPVGDSDVTIASSATQMQGATITLTNPKPGDLLSLAGALPAGISLDGGSTASQIILTGLASAAAYETAIGLARFATGGDTPDTEARVINVVVTDDGANPSNTAVSIITVTPTNDFPTPLDDDFGGTDESAVLAAGGGGLLLGSVFDDNGSGADSDPEGNDIDVSAVSNIVTADLPAGTVVSAVNDGGTDFNFTLTASGRVATVFVDKESGDVNVEATTGDYFGLLGGSDTASISFDYAIADPQGSNGTAATASFTVSGLPNVIFIDNSVSGGGNNGSQSDPFESIAAFNAANTPAPGVGSDAIVFVRTGTGTYSETDGLKLQNDQTLLGQERADLLPAAFGESVGIAPVIATTGGTNDGILLASNNTVRGLDIGNTTGSGISDGGGTVGSLTISDVAIGGSGKALDIDQGGTLAATFESIASTGSGSEGIDLSGLGGSFSVTGATTVSGNTGNGIDLTGNTGSFTFNGLDVTTAAGTGIGLNATGGGTLTVVGPGSDIDTSAGTGTAVNIANTTIGAGGVTFKSISVDGAANGIVLDGTGNGTFTITGDGTNIQNASGGTIQNTTSHGIVLNDTGGFSISSLDILDPGNSDTATGVDIDGIQATEIRGINLIRGVEFNSTNSAGGDSHAIELENNGVSLEEFRIVDSLFDEGLGGSSAIRADLEAGTVNGNFIVIDNRFEDHSVAAVDFAIGDNTVGNGTINIVIADNIFDGRSDVVVSNDIIIAVQDEYTVNAQVHNNTITEVKPAASTAGVINAVVGDATAPGPDVDLRFTENTIDEIRGRAGFNIILEQNIADYDVTLFDNLVTDLVDGTGPAVNAFGREAAEFEIEDNAGAGEIRIVENTFGTLAEPVAGNGSREGIDIAVQNTTSPDVLIHDNDIVVSGISSGEAIEFDVEDTASLDLTVTNNNLTGGNQNEGFTIETEDPGSSAIVRFTGNTSADEIEFDRDQGSLTIFNRDTLGADNPGVSGPFTLVDGPGTTTIAPNLPTGVVLATDGLAQVVEINTAAGGLLEVTVLNADGSRASGVTVTFTAPGAGASGTFTGGNTALTNASGVATKAFTANGIEGAYEITATAAGFEGATFLFQNEDSPVAFLTATAIAEHGLDGAEDLSQAELDATVAAAEARWAEAGLTAGQLETLQGLSFEIADLEGAALGAIRGSQVQIDVNAAGHGWYVDETPFDDGEFVGGDGIEAMDLLTTVMHEMGHSLGLEDLYGAVDAHDLMYALLETGERRSPNEGQADTALDLGELLGGADGGIAGLEGRGNATVPASGDMAAAAAYGVAGLGDPADALGVVA